MKVLAFDIGIKNLAWCLLDTDLSGKPVVRGWQNYNLLAGEEAGIKHQAPPCMFCKTRAAFYTAAGQTCQRHCPAGQPPLKDLSGNLQRTASLPVLRTLCPKKGTKAALMAALAPRTSFPIEKVKVKKAVDTDMAILHDSIRVFITANLAHFRQATHICLENQPVLKNPTMKTVQILLYATLRDLLHPAPPIKLVHASKKNTGSAAETGDAGYKTRKDATEAKAVQILEGSKVVDSAMHLATFKSHVKRSDLADALCMCWDFAGL